tara:strand:+ start:202 stop:696 length:495 start_codon:yes stop_codon:yes gene_type:complete
LELKNEMKIYDDFLKLDDHKNLYELMVQSPLIDWHFYNGVNMPRDGNYQFSHLFYAEFQPRSKFFNNILPIIDKLKPISIVRIKSNLNIRTFERINFGLHTDVDNCITAIYYVNSNDGYTYFEDGTKVDSIANRMVIFNSNMKHAGCTPTDELCRCVINFNYHL